MKGSYLSSKGATKSEDFDDFRTTRIATGRSISIQNKFERTKMFETNESFSEIYVEHVLIFFEDGGGRFWIG